MIISNESNQNTAHATINSHKFGKLIFSMLVTSGISNIDCSAYASEFSITEQSIPNLGNAASGGAALAEDASTVFYNPAGLTRLSGNSLQGAGYVIFSLTFKIGVGLRLAIYYLVAIVPKVALILLLPICTVI